MILVWDLLRVRCFGIIRCAFGGVSLGFLRGVSLQQYFSRENEGFLDCIRMQKGVFEEL